MVKVITEIDDNNLRGLIQESNQIEGIYEEVTATQLEATRNLLEELPEVPLTPRYLTDYIRLFQPDAELRSKSGMNVRVGLHRPPLGGKHVVTKFEMILTHMNSQHTSRPNHIFKCHCDFENLHPYTDGNGRLGRMLMLRQAVHHEARIAYTIREVGFLQAWYYLTLQAHSPKPSFLADKVQW